MPRSFLTSMFRSFSLGALALVAATGCSSTPAKTAAGAERGYLVIAHGSVHHHDGHPGHHHHAHHAAPANAPDPREEQRGRPWEQSVLKTVAEAEPRLDGPVEVAFGMWDHIAFQRAVDRLAARGVTELRVIPLFVNSNSSVVRGQKYQFGVSATPLAELPELARIQLPPGLRLSYGQALDESAHLTRILTRRARDLAREPQKEELILVAHGPVGAEENELWLKSLQGHADKINAELAFAKLHVVSLRDDAEKKVRDESTRQLRAIVTAARKSGRQALVLPVLIASGGIDRGIGQRLQGLPYRYTGAMIAPDPELANWIADSATR